MDPERIERLMDRMGVPPERRAKVAEKIEMIWADRIEENVIAAEAVGFPEVTALLDSIAKGK